MGGHLFRVEGIGEILFERSTRAKRISISVRPFKGVRVAVPMKPGESLLKGWMNWQKRMASDIIVYSLETRRPSGGVVRQKTTSASMSNLSGCLKD